MKIYTLLGITFNYRKVRLFIRNNWQDLLMVVFLLVLFAVVGTMEFESLK